MKNVTRTELLPGVFLTHVKTDKFKTGCLNVTLLTQLSGTDAAHHALIPRVLLRGTKTHPDMTQISEKTEALYGAKITPLIRKKGEIQCVSLFATFVDDAVLPPGETVFGAVAALVGDVLTNPVLERGRLSEAYVTSEREKLLDEIRGRINNKGSYAVSRLVEQMCDGEDFATFKLGTEAEAEEITAKSLTDAYRTLIATAPVELFYSGTASVAVVEDALKNALSTLPREEPNLDLGTDVRLNSRDETARYFEETLDVTQGKLSIGFRLGDSMEDPDYPAIMLLHYLYGGSVNSKLFLNVRERLSLCYYASSVLEKHKGLLLVASGIEFDMFDKAKTEILAQLDAIARKDVSDDELIWAKQALVTDLAMLEDSLAETEDFYLDQTLLGEEDDLSAQIKRVNSVSKDTLAKIASGLELDAIYFLKGQTEGA